MRSSVLVLQEKRGLPAVDNGPVQHEKAPAAACINCG